MNFEIPSLVKKKFFTAPATIFLENSMFQLYTDIQGYMCTQAKTLCTEWSKTTGAITKKYLFK